MNARKSTTRRTTRTRRTTWGAAIAAVLSIATTPALATTASAHDASGATVYTLSNEASGNAVLAFDRARDGSLSGPRSYPTGGRGTGAGLGSQGALTLTPDGQFLLAVDAGSDELSVFAVGGGTLRLLDREPSGGDLPISVDVRHRLVYVLNAGGSPNITGFRLDERGLQAVPHGTRDLSPGAAGPAQVGFARDGEHLIVTLKASNAIDTFPVRDNGQAGPPAVTPSVGATPFGFAVDRRGHVLVSNAEGGAPGASSTTSYTLEDGALSAVGPAVATTQTAACWVVATHDSRFAYATNTGSGTVSLYSVARNGALTLDDPTAATDIGAPTDAALAERSRFLYVLDSAGHSVHGYRVDRHDGALSAVAGTPDIPPGTVGLAASS